MPDWCDWLPQVTIEYPAMSAYEAQVWSDLQEFWKRKAERRELPPKAQGAIDSAGAKVKGAASATSGFVRDHTPKPVKDVGGFALDRSLEATVKATVGLMEWVTETVQEFSDPKAVFTFHREKGRPVDNLAAVRALDLEELDELTRRFVWKCRTTGMVEGAALGGVTFIPVAGSVAAIGLDLVIMHALSTAIATRAAHAYGIDPGSAAGQEHLNRMLRKAWAAQAPKTGTVNGARRAFDAGAGRVRWSDKFRNDHRIAAAVEKLMKQAGNGSHVPIEKVVAKMPYIAVGTAAGINSTVLASLAKTSVKYSQTVHLATKYNLVLPPNLA